jgi:hypothetical protein
MKVHRAMLITASVLVATFVMWAPQVVAQTPTTPASQDNWQDPSKHKVQFVTVENGARLEVLDWGGSGGRWFCWPGWGSPRMCLMASRKN